VLVCPGKAGSAKNKSRNWNSHGSKGFSAGVQALRLLLVHSKGSMASGIVCPEVMRKSKHGQQTEYLPTTYRE